MRSQRMTWMGLAAVWMLGMGASTEGVRQARDWQYQGELATAGHQWDIAYQVHTKLAETFPGTRHGRLGAARARRNRAALLSPARSPASEDPGSWIEELFDFLTWP